MSNELVRARAVAGFRAKLAAQQQAHVAGGTLKAEAKRLMAEPEVKEWLKQADRGDTFSLGEDVVIRKSAILGRAVLREEFGPSGLALDESTSYFPLTPGRWTELAKQGVKPEDMRRGFDETLEWFARTG